jgi:LSD1 subclass zinc finger protein
MLRCNHCGAPLQVAPGQAVATCSYCQTVTRIAATRPPGRGVRSSPVAPARMLVSLAAGGVLVTGAIAALLAQSTSRRATAPAPERPTAMASPTHLEAAPPEPIAPAMTPLAPPDAATDDAAAGPDLADAAPAARAPRPRGPAGPDPGPVVTKQEAEQILRPEVLACMREQGVHYLITRLGNQRQGGRVPPLALTGTSVVDYQPTPGFAKTPLGRCVARAASAVRAPAYRGNYIYFGLRNDAVPDPLADAPARLDPAAARQALATLDDEARDCAARHPAGSRPGEPVSIMVFFLGATGQVSDVQPYHVDKKSAYSRCLSTVYRKATVGRFRAIDHKILHVLTP